MSRQLLPWEGVLKVEATGVNGTQGKRREEMQSPGFVQTEDSMVTEKVIQGEGSMTQGLEMGETLRQVDQGGLVTGAECWLRIQGTGQRGSQPLE